MKPLLLFLMLGNVMNSAAPQKPFHPCIAGGFKQTVVFLGVVKDPPKAPAQAAEPVFTGTGFLVAVEGITYLVTAKHVVLQILSVPGSPEKMIAAANLKTGQMTVLSFAEQQRQHRAGWIIHQNADVAMIPFALPPTLNARVIPERDFLPVDALQELQEVFYFSFQPDLDLKERITPITRRGMVSLIQDARTVILDAFTFPGNSGSPVFIRPSPVGFAEGGVVVAAGVDCKFIGLVGGYIPYREAAISQQTGRPRVVFEENTGLAVMITVDAINELIASEAFQKQHKALLGTQPKSTDEIPRP